MKLALFDLGDTLIYRVKSHICFDAELLSEQYNTPYDEVLHSLNMVAKTSPYKDIYSFVKIRKWTLTDELDHMFDFFGSVLKDLQISKTRKLEDTVSKRFLDNRYFINDDALGILQNLKREGYRIGVLSNGKPSRRLVLKALNLEADLDKDLIFISDELGHSKPSEEIYEIVEQQVKDRLGVVEEILLIDDEYENIKQASQRGWNTLFFKRLK